MRKSKYDLRPIKVGDTVVIHPNLHHFDGNESPSYCEEMLELAGRRDTVKAIETDIYLKNIYQWRWNKKWIIKVPPTFNPETNNILPYIKAQSPSFIGKERTPLQNKVEVTFKVHNYLASVYRSITPKVYLLGKNNKGIISEAVRLRKGTSGCDYMPEITTESFTKGYMKLYKKNLTPCGIARIGSEFGTNAYFGSDHGLSMREFRDGIVISYGKSQQVDGQLTLVAHQVFPTNSEERQVELEYQIVK